MKKWLGVLASVGLLCVLATSVEAGTIIRWGDVLAADHPSVVMISRVAKQVAEKTQGRVEIQAYPASQLGSSKDQIEAVALGTQQIVTEGAANFGQWVPSISIIEAPYVWRDDVHLTKVMSGPIGQDLNKQLV
ncbi:MAG: dicarboxylate transporter subunit DctP, partial [candidate division NC10 bacterium]|nr:dicarboxylate transporter subunit DctP [candidate division NC10 bacterium]